jgi:hypothetical protein
MDKERRSRLKRVVTEARKVVEEDVRIQLRRLGFDESGKVRPVEELSYLSSEDKELRNKIVEAVEKEKTGGISDREAFDRYVRHVGFTYVNRIAALRAMEVRKLIKETVLRRDVYGGRSLREYEIAEREGIVDPYRLLKTCLVEAFREVSAEIKVLFDVNSEYSLVFPGHKALLELFRLLSEEVPEEDWKEDDIIGWIYQYYNEEARAEFKRSKQKPKADDIPVINQFYTPRWVVRVLVDNTLGRLWLEMNGRCPKLGDPIVRTKEQLANPSGDTVDEFCSYLVPLSQEPPPRKKKRVREIKILDPACGSGHFLVYAFDVLYKMYKEDEPETSVKEIPRLILEHNLYGIDIDLRAVQLAALSLYLKAKSYNRKLKITKMNLVCADARITDGKVRKVFLERFGDDPELQKIFAKIFEDLEYTYEIGSLLKVREPFERLLERRRREGGVQAILLPRIRGQTVISRSGKIEGQAKLDMKITEDKEAVQIIAIPREVTLEHMLNALKEFEREAMEKRDMGTLLFATEAEKSVGLLALLTQKYDVVLMNPAYGNMPSRTKDYVKKHYQRTKKDYYTAFIEQAIDLTEENGFIGMLTSRTFMFLKAFQNVREDILLNDATPELILDAGFGILDGATVETAATVARKVRGLSYDQPTREVQCTFCRLTTFDTYEKERAFTRSLLDYLQRTEADLWYRTFFKNLKLLPGTTYAYWASASLCKLFTLYDPLDCDLTTRKHCRKIAYSKKGLSTGDDKRFIRFHWEVESTLLHTGRRWIPFAKGGEYAKYYADIPLVVNWEHDGKEIKDYVKERYPYLENINWVIHDEGFYFKDGLTYSRVSVKGFSVRKLPVGCIYGEKGPSIFFEEPSDIWAGLGLLCSKLVQVLLLMQTPSRAWEISHVASIPWTSRLSTSNVPRLSKEAHDILREWDTGNETSTIFIKPWVLQVLQGFNPEEKPTSDHSFAKQFSWEDWDSLKEIRSVTGTKKMTLRELASLAIKRKEIMQKRIEELQKQIDEEIYRIYEISEEDKKLIEREFALSRGEFSLSQEGALDIDKEKQSEIPVDVEGETTDHVARLVSFYIKNALEMDPDGIIPLHQIVGEVRKSLVKDFGAAQIDLKEKEIEEIFGKSLEDWIATDYFDFHVNLYKRRPIFWHLTSSNFSRTRGSKGSFNIFIHYHKLDRDIIPKIQVNYLRPELDRAKWKVDRLKRELQEARDIKDKLKERRLSHELDSALSTLEELQNFQKALEEVRNSRKEKTKLPKNARWVDQKIAEVRDNGYNPVIDYGVRVNIEPLKEANLLHKAAKRVK